MRAVKYFFMSFVLVMGLMACDDDDNQQSSEGGDQIIKVGVAFGEAGRTVLRNGGKVQIPVVLEKAAEAMVRVSVAPIVSDRDTVAEEGIDFMLEEKVINIPAGETTGYVNVDILDPGKAIKDKTVDLSIKTVYGGGVKSGTQQTFRLAITSNSFIEFEKMEWTTYESAVTTEEYKSTCRIPLKITGAVLSTATVEIAVADSSAKEYQHFELASKKITVNPGDEMLYVELIPTDDKVVNYDRIFSLSVVTVSGGNLTIGKMKSACRVAIVSEEVIKTARFKVSDLKDTEGKTIEVAVVLDHAPSVTEDPVVVDIAPVEGNGNAVLDVDYRLSAKTLTFAAGEKEKVVDLVFINNKDLFNKEFSLILKSAVGAELVKTPLKVVMVNDDFPYFLSNYNTTEGSGTNSIPVCIPEALDYDITLHLETIEKTAVEGKHFDFKNKTVTIKAGDTKGTVSFEALVFREWKENSIFEIKVVAVDRYPFIKEIKSQLTIVKNEGYRKWLGAADLKMGAGTFPITLSAGSTDAEFATNFGKYYLFDKMRGNTNWIGKLRYTKGAIEIMGADSGYSFGQYDFKDGRGPLNGKFVWRKESTQPLGAYYTSNCPLQENGSTLSIASDVTVAFFWYKGTSAIYLTDAITAFSITRK
ncbi:MAG: Calx-beta domain-containing protein [Odoribacter sp.]